MQVLGELANKKINKIIIISRLQSDASRKVTGKGGKTADKDAILLHPQKRHKRCAQNEMKKESTVNISTGGKNWFKVVADAILKLNHVGEHR